MDSNLVRLVFEGLYNRKPSAAELKKKRAEELALIVDRLVYRADHGTDFQPQLIAIHVPPDLAAQYTGRGLLTAISANLRRMEKKGYLDRIKGGYSKRKHRLISKDTTKLSKKEATAALYLHVDDCLRKNLFDNNLIEGSAATNIREGYKSPHAFRTAIIEVKHRILVGDTGKHLK